MEALDLEALLMSKGLPGVYIEVLASPNAYTGQQLDNAMRLAWLLKRGRFLLLEPPCGQ
jgi:hypothetical protein